ncbi:MULTISPECIES: hypothetical protein [Mycobacteriaceae]|uniref:hypothetical protein n=1 Tax=Mycobacteriaceae TaxID=1762 RepID=UPI00035D9C67|nr:MULTISPECIES: hypothetical protein [Mycobacteriaceae]AHC24151.2 hypothetical protein D174_05920 [Mycolicibacterium neoaurum VKM Ac-1815D]AXK76925.1 VWA domain-containing protein [Mycolicibacterium neoaurum]KJQ51886.1 hypothetical protein TS71_04060 [Mycolicibacterium neoaurum]KUM10345.1 hypothetical protein AVZ31_01320 [Mycolicibacterium neoaurum]
MGNAVGRFVVAVLSAVLLAGLAFVGAGIARAVDQNAGANRFGACLAAQKTGDLLLLFDQSSSLQSTDPEDARLKAARYLLGTLGTYADRVGADLQVSAAGFSDTYKPGPSWTRLTEQSAGGAGDQIADIARTDDGIDTDYQLALSGARQALAERGSGPGGAPRCQAIAWFSDGKIDYTVRSASKPYADGVTLNDQAGVDATRQQAIDSICRPGGVADQVRSGSIIMLGVGLGAAQSPADFDVMSAISTGNGLNGMSCGQITEPIPGSFYSVSNIDDMLFAFDALNPDPGVTNTAPVCRIQVCPEARHNFTLDRSIKSVSILGSGGVPGVVPYLVAPSGETLELPKVPGPTDVTVAGIPVRYEWQSESAQTIALSNAGAPGWSGQWAIVYVDTTGEHPDAVSKVSIHITTDIYPALADKDNLAWHSGSVLDGVTFGLVDGQGSTLRPTDLAGAAVLSASLEPAGAQSIPILQAVPKEAIATPVDVDLTAVSPGPATLKLSLVVTTAPALDPAGVQVAPGTELSPQDVEVPIQILPKLGLPTPGTRVDFGTGETANGVTSSLDITGPGCAWVADSDAPEVVASPDGIGAVSVTSSSNSAQTCLKVADGETGTLQLTLRTEANGQGGLNGTLPLHVAALENPDDSQVVDVPFTASLLKPLNTTNFVLVLIAALLLGPGIPLALLYLSKWWVSKIPDTPLLAERIQVEFDGDTLRRDGRPFAMADTDLVNPVPGLAGGARSLSVLGVNLVAQTGRSPFGIGRVVVESGGLISTGSELPGTDDSGLRAVLPLAVHNKWVVLHDPHGPANAAEILLLVAGSTDIPARERIFDEIGQRAGELLNGLRLRAVQAGLAPVHDDPGASASPFGGGGEAVAPAADPFGGGPPVVHGGLSIPASDPFTAQSAEPRQPAESPVPQRPVHPDDAVRPVPPPPPPAGPPGAGPPAPPRFDPDPFDPFE